MKLNSFEELFVCLLSDIYEFENQIITDLPKVLKKVHSEELKQTVQTHLMETKEQIKRLDKIFQIVGQKPIKMGWAGEVKNLVTQIGGFLDENTSSPLLDAAIIVMLQRIEHFEISTYGTLREFAKVLNYDVDSIIKDSLKEESHADETLTKLAEGGFFSKGINVTAAR